MVAGDAVARARLLHENGRSAEAMRLLAPHLASAPDDEEALWIAGFAQLTLGDVEGATSAASRMAALAPENPDAHLLAAAVLSQRKEHLLARNAATRAVQLAPHSPLPYRMAASVDLAADSVNDWTEHHARRAVELDPHSAHNHRILGSVLLELKRRDEAGEALHRAAALAPDDETVRHELARWNLASGRTSVAAEGFAAVIRADPTDSNALHNLRLTVGRTFWYAQLVLWGCFLLLARTRSLSDGDSAAWMRAGAPILLVATLGMWFFQLRRNWRGVGVMVRAVRGQWVLQIGLATHIACLVCVAVGALLPGEGGLDVLAVGLVFLALSTLATWLYLNNLKKALDTR